MCGMSPSPFSSSPLPLSPPSPPLPLPLPKVLDEFNAHFEHHYGKKSSKIKYKIGISSGRVVAGVIGTLESTVGKYRWN